MKAYEDCPRFERCAVNKCPLDPAYKEMPSVPGDAERKCTLPRRKRQEIGAKYENLAYGGLTPQEHSGLSRFGKLPQNSQKIAICPCNSERPIESGVRV